MNLDEKLKISFKRPFEDYKKMLIGMLISAIPIINYLIYGYFIECSNRIFKKDYKLPDFDDFLRILTNTLVYLLIAIVYFIPFFIVLFITVLELINNANVISELVKNLNLETNTDLLLLFTQLLKEFWPLILLIVVVAFITSYLVIIALINYSRNYNITDGFKLKEILKFALNIKFFAFYLLTALYTIFVNVITASLFFWMPFGKYISSGVAVFITGVTQFTLLSFICSEIIERHEKLHIIQKHEKIKHEQKAGIIEKKTISRRTKNKRVKKK
ncbi:MAG: DUF4013 domain-containing protein [Candidatus Woesearchaeota archaeon]